MYALGIILLQAPERIPLQGEAKSKTPGYTPPPCGEYHDTILYNAPYAEPSIGEFIENASDRRPDGAPG